MPAEPSSSVNTRVKLCHGQQCSFTALTHGHKTLITSTPVIKLISLESNMLTKKYVAEFYSRKCV